MAEPEDEEPAQPDDRAWLTSAGRTSALDDAEATGAHVHVQQFWLVVTAGPDAGATFTSSAERAVLGTHESADVLLHDETVSRFHCEISVAQGKITIRDLGSRNGTRVNGVSVLAAYLRDG